MIAPAGDGLLISVGFWGLFALYLVADRAIDGWLDTRLRYLFCVVGSAGFLWYFTSVGAAHLGALYVGLSVVYLSARGALTPGRRPGGARLMLVLGFVVTLWALGKIGSSLGLSHLSWLFFVGASFALVKIWTFCKDLYDGRIEEPRLLTFLAYCTFFPCFLSGPMHYFGEFREAFENRQPLDGSALVDSAFRILHGLVKVLIVAVALRPYSLDVLRDSGISAVSPIELGWRSVAYSLVIYLDFSGYSDIAIASGGLLGVRVPENFRLPYLARDLREFWQRWHITFTRFLTQYLFIPFARAFQSRFVTAPALATSSAAYLTTFLFCGFWHGSTANYLIWGLYHGAGMIAVDVTRRRSLAAGRRPQPRTGIGPRVRRVVWTTLTFLFVSLGWIFFTLPMGFWGR